MVFVSFFIESILLSNFSENIISKYDTTVWKNRKVGRILDVH